MIDGYYSAAGSPSSFTHHGQTNCSDNPGNVASAIERQAPNSPQSLLHLSVNDTPAQSSTSSPNVYGLFPAGASPALPSEMSGVSSPTPELSPNPERLQINQPRSSSSIFDVDGCRRQVQPVPSSADEANGMQPNLGTSHDNRNSGNSHVMSWMSYDDGAAGPTASCSR